MLWVGVLGALPVPCLLQKCSSASALPTSFSLLRGVCGSRVEQKESQLRQPEASTLDCTRAQLHTRTALLWGGGTTSRTHGQHARGAPFWRIILPLPCICCTWLFVVVRRERSTRDAHVFVRGFASVIFLRLLASVVSHEVELRWKDKSTTFYLTKSTHQQRGLLCTTCDLPTSCLASTFYTLRHRTDTDDFRGYKLCGNSSLLFVHTRDLSSCVRVPHLLLLSTVIRCVTDAHPLLLLHLCRHKSNLGIFILQERFAVVRRTDM